MAASGDVTFTQNGGEGNLKLHPYLIAIARWCVSRLWSTATVLIHRLLTTPLPPITATKTTKTRQAGTDHLHPEPRVECVVLHQPPEPCLDVIFVHGLYGSLGNTWRQGDWRSKYNIELNTVPLKRSSSIPTNCDRCDKQTDKYIYNKVDNIFSYKEHIFRNIDEKLYEDMKEIDDEVYIAERFYNNTLLNQVEIVDNYDTRAKFVQELFEKEYIDKEETVNKGVDAKEIDCVCKNNESKCETGCGCVCDECYSSCWPRDWIRVDHPGARVISVNYTSDPYLWRPLWIKESKRLRLHERAEQMIQQLLGLGVGQRPIIWVGHSKGGLFIKQIYCEAYEAHLKLRSDNLELTKNLNLDLSTKTEKKVPIKHEMKFIKDFFNDKDPNIINEERDDNNSKDIVNNNYQSVTKNGSAHTKKTDEGKKDTSSLNCKTENDCVATEKVDDGNRYNGVNGVNDGRNSSNNEEAKHLKTRASLWSNSAGFMFYSVPHRGSPLADIKTPITARSVELLEISKDCSLVLTLQDRWLRATASSQPLVRSLVETCRTLMSVLWLRIVSVDSADPGIGALCGVSVDHREICKPSSRRCLLYTELMNLINAAINRCRCQ